jgi:outer membrane receptor protein involved in Fe transport
MSQLKSWRRLLIATSAIFPVMLAAGAHAADAGPLSAKDDTMVLQEVTVTATRTSQVLSKVPISVSAFTQDTMDKQGIKSFSDIARYTPGVTFDEGTKDVSIRGIASNAGDATTGIYIDDTPIQLRTLGFNSNNTLPAVFDLDRVEVLRGPQGTLFGAGSEGGTVRYITPQPSLSKFTTYARSEVSQTRNGAPSYEAGVAIGGPIIPDKLGFRVSVYDRHDGGYIDRFDTATGKVSKENSNWMDTFQWRAALSWAPTERLIITPTLQFQMRNQRDTDTFWQSLSNRAGGTYQNGNFDRQSDYDRFYLGSLKIEYDLGKAKIISNTSAFTRREYLLNGYEGTIYNLAFFGSYVGAGVDPAGNACAEGSRCLSLQAANPDSPLLNANGANLPGFGRYNSPNSITNAQQNFTQELRIQSTDSDARLTWVAGVFYTKNRQESIEEIHDPQMESLMQYLFSQSVTDGWGMGLLANGDDYYNRNVGHSTQTAIFGDATYKVTDKLKVTAGLRYASTKFDIANNAIGPQNYGESGGKAGQSDQPFTPKLSVSYQASDDHLAYATVSKGYRIGGANVPLGQGLLDSCAADLAARNITTLPQTYNSDSTVSYELGAKDKFLNRTLQLSTSVYHVDWSNIQYQDLLSNCGINYTTNLGSVESNGFDLQATWLVKRNLEVDLAVGYTNARFTKTAGVPSSPTVMKGDAVGGPPWTISIGARWDFSLADLPAYIRVDDEYASRNGRPTPMLDPNTAAYDPALVKPPATNYLSLRAGTKLDKWDVSLFADNLLNAHPQLTYGHMTGSSPIFIQSTVRPLTVGITTIYRY